MKQQVNALLKINTLHRTIATVIYYSQTGTYSNARLHTPEYSTRSRDFKDIHWFYPWFITRKVVFHVGPMVDVGLLHIAPAFAIVGFPHQPTAGG